MRILLYILSIIAANIVTAKIPPANFGLFIVPSGSFLIGLTFILRDLVQNRYGRRNTYKVIALALVLSAATSIWLGDVLWITIASALAFLLSESSDTEIYTRLHLPMASRVLYSGIVGGILDSVTFVIIGLSPIGVGFLAWNEVPLAVLGQVLVKTGMQLIGAGVMNVIEKKQIIHG